MISAVYQPTLADDGRSPRAGLRTAHQQQCYRVARANSQAGQGGAPATARSTWRRLHGSLRPLTCSAASCFFLSRAGSAGPANCADACVGRTPHQGESVSIKRRCSGMVATAVRLSSIFSEQPFTPAGRGEGR